MSVATTTAPAPGWYPDPHGSTTHIRWWDGADWTAHTDALPATVPEFDAYPFFATTIDSDVEHDNFFEVEDDTSEWAELDDPAEPEFSAFAFVADRAPEPDPETQVEWRPPVERRAAYRLDVVRHASAAGHRAALDPICGVAPEPIFRVAVHAPQPDPEPEPEPAPAPFSFRARAVIVEPDPEPVAGGTVVEPEPAVVLPVYGSPLLTISSPVPAVVESRAPEPVPVPVPVEVPVPTAPVAAVVAEPAALPVEPKRRTRRPSRKTGFGVAAVVVAAAGAAGVTNLLTGDGATTVKDAGQGPAALAAADQECLKEWNTTASGDAAQLRVTLGQFAGALARVGTVDPLPGTLMQPNSCGLTVYDPASDTNAVFVAGVKDQVGYMDVTAYPRSSQYGFPKSAREANVTINADGTLRGL